jgi:hypothetical protein
MSNQLLVSELWKEHEKAPFPSGLRGEEIFGVDLVMLDADAAGLVQTFSRSGRLNARQVSFVEPIVRDLELVLPALSGEGRVHFDRLLRALRAMD